ncbi:hypothetical protein NDU88_004240 [Pleurodeles waltl]|uniref:Uncharacterized protein n=1 Tax=Pleurodeles waltl TaxID=8319 RepID=A0AAV7VI59_PLEWA|nr:hypothetical protein NDU88_004240 [Pleurodeles waltl]
MHPSGTVNRVMQGRAAVRLGLSWDSSMEPSTKYLMGVCEVAAAALAHKSALLTGFSDQSQTRQRVTFHFFPWQCAFTLRAPVFQVHEARVFLRQLRTPLEPAQ